MIDILNANLADILPQSLKIDSQFVSIAQALNPILQKIARDSRKAMHLPRLDELEGIILDVLAEQFHVDNYNSATLDDEQKRAFIRNSIALHRLKGTVYAVEYVVNQFFKDALVNELEGFLFRIEAKEYIAAPEAFDTFVHMLFDAKPVRSWLVSIDLDLSPPPSDIFAGNILVDDTSETISFALPKGFTAAPFVASPIIFSDVITIGGRS